MKTVFDWDLFEMLIKKKGRSSLKTDNLTEIIPRITGRSYDNYRMLRGRVRGTLEINKLMITILDKMNFNKSEIISLITTKP